MENSEEFKFVPGYGNRYAISRNGNIISYACKNPIFLKKLTHKHGYMMVALYDKEGIKYHKGGVFRTVGSVLMDTYGPPKPSPKCKVIYIDGNRKNLNLDNLRWGTQDEIMKIMTNKRLENLNV